MEQRDLVEALHLSSTCLTTIVDDVLLVSKLDRDKIEIRQEPFDLRRFTQQVADAARLTVESKGLEFRVTVAPGLPVMVMGDQNRLMQVVNNLLSNALKFTQQGSISLRLSPWTEGEAPVISGDCFEWVLFQVRLCM